LITDGSTPTTNESLSVIVPIYNEVQSLCPLLEEIEKHIAPIARELEVICVDDGSTDDSLRMLKSMTAKFPYLKVIRQKNQGHGAALSSGILSAKMQWLLLIDSDREIPLEVFSKFWRDKSDFDAVFGARKERADGALRKWGSRFLRNVLGLFYSQLPRDLNCPFKLVRRESLIPLNDWLKSLPLVPSIEIALYVSQVGRHVSLGVDHKIREFGESHLKKLKFLKFGLRAFFEILRFKMKTHQRERT